jgi:hypothetical protein
LLGIQVSALLHPAANAVFLFAGFIALRSIIATLRGEL